MLFQGHYENSSPKFRLTGTAPSGDIHPVVWANEEVMVDAVVNNGVFLCMQPGYYHFSAALSADENGKYVGVLSLITLEIKYMQGKYDNFSRNNDKL